MGDEASITDARLAKAANRSGTLLFVIFFLLAIFVDFTIGIFDDVSRLNLGIFLVLLLMTLLLQYRRILDLDNQPMLVLAMYHALFSIFVLWILPFGTAYLFVGLQLVFMASYAYGKFGAAGSTLYLASMHLLSFIFQSQTPTEDEFATLVRTLSVFFLLATLVYVSVHVSRREIYDLTKTGDKLKAEHQRLLALINSMGDAVVATDKNGSIISYNGAALDIIDTNVTISGEPLGHLLNLTNDKGERVDVIADTAKKNRNVKRRDLIHTYPDGDKINVYINITPIKIGYGENAETGFTIIMRDITKEKSLEEERDEFISVVSHELRTPITVTEGKVSNAMLYNNKEVKNKAIAKSLDEAHQQVIFLADMINDLSTLARAERDALDVEPEKIDCKQLVKDLHAAYEIEAKQKKLQLKVQIAKSVPSITTSQLYLKEVLQNFITNSIKYTKKGSITIGVKAAGRGKGVTFTVKDTGIGISKSDQKKLFDKFFRSEDFRTRESSGTGLGLYVTAKIAQKINAKIDVSSTLNKGSTFSITVKSLKTKKRRHSEA